MAERMIEQKLLAVQEELKAPKSLHNSFGEYNYRSLEQILEAVKPLLKKQGLLLTIKDDIVLVGDRYYVKATATLSCGDESIQTTALARETLEKKKLDASQITGAASSYARKYCLNGLFLIDDTKDADADEQPDEQPAELSDMNAQCSEAELKTLEGLCKQLGWNVQKVFPAYPNITKEQYGQGLQRLRTLIENNNKVKGAK